MARGWNASDEESEVEEVPQGAEQVGSEEEGGEAEYEIETILDAKHGAFPGGKIGYLVKWKNYDDEHNSWVNEDDAANAQDAVDLYWKKHGKSGKKPTGRKSDVKNNVSAAPGKKRKTPVPISESEEELAPKKRGRPPKAKPVSEVEVEERQEASTKKAARKGVTKKTKAPSPEPMDEDEDEEHYEDMKKWKDAHSWDHLVDHIDTVERQDDGKLYVYFRLKANKGQSGGLCREESSVCKKKMPQLLLDFYERNLRWRPLGEEEEA